jgi:hypothetical protein
VVLPGRGCGGDGRGDGGVGLGLLEGEALGDGAGALGDGAGDAGGDGVGDAGAGLGDGLGDGDGLGGGAGDGAGGGIVAVGVAEGVWLAEGEALGVGDATVGDGLGEAAATTVIGAANPLPATKNSGTTAFADASYRPSMSLTRTPKRSCLIPGPSIAAGIDVSTNQVRTCPSCWGSSSVTPVVVPGR